MDKKISELDQALQINNDAVFPISQDNGGTDTTYKVTITQISAEVAEDQTFSNLQTSSKKLVGAINELLSLGNPIILGTSAPTSSQGEDGNIYVQYTAGTGGADDEVDGIYVKIDGAWCEIQTGGGGSGGHTIVDDAGTSLPQRTDLQFIGAYSEDNSQDDTTEVNVARAMTKAQFDLLSAAEKAGIINVTDETSAPLHNYSTSEQVVGTWLDGSPLYEQTVTNINLSHNSWTTIFEASAINATIREYSGMISLDGSVPYCQLEYYRNSGEFSCTSINGGDLKLLANIQSPEKLLWATIRYTKASI